MFLHKTPYIVQKLYPSLTWREPTREKILYLTFDDGPVPGITPRVLEVLKKYDAGLLFFVWGIMWRSTRIFSKEY